MPAAKTTFSAADVTLRLDRLDQLIDNYLCTLIENSSNVKLADFTRLVELRFRIVPTDDNHQASWKVVNDARQEKLAEPAPPSAGEEPSE